MIEEVEEIEVVEVECGFCGYSGNKFILVGETILCEECMVESRVFLDKGEMN